MANPTSKPLETTRPASYIELLRGNRSFRQVWLGQVVSQMGDWFDTIALYTIILNLTGSGRAVGLLLVARFLPSFVFGSLSGVVADRFSRRSIMIISDLLRAVVVLGFLFVRRADQLWIIYFLTVLQLALSTFFEPAKTAAIPSLVSDRELVAANAISSVTWSIMLTMGAAIGGVVTGWFGTDVAFILDALTYLLSAALIASVRVPKRPPREKTKLTIKGALGITETIEGARYVKRRPRVLALLLVKPAWGLGGGILTLLAVFGEKIFPVGKSAATGIGVLFAARGIGTAVGPIVARRISGEGKQRMQVSIGIAFLIGGFFYMAFGTASSFVVALIVLGLAHTGGSILWVFSTVLLQRGVEDNFRGRVFAAELALLTLTMAASNYVTGELLDRFGLSPRAVAIGIGAFFLVPAVAWFATQRWWDRDQTQRMAETVLSRYQRSTFRLGVNMEPTIEQDDRPREVSRAAQFLASSLAIGLITSIFHLAQRISGVAMVFALLVVIAVFGIGFLVIWRISAIRWMKIVTSGLLILSAALAVLALIALFSANHVAALACAVASVLAYLVHKRRNWARIVWLVLILFGLPFAIPANLQEIRRNVLSGTLSLIVTLLQLIGTWLLFTRNSNRWFRTHK